MLINLNFFSVSQAGQQCLKRAIEAEEARMPENYERPLLRIKKVPNNLFDTLTVRRAFSVGIIKGIMNYF